MVRMILYFKAAVIGGHRTTLIKESWVSLISEHAVYIIANNEGTSLTARHMNY